VPTRGSVSYIGEGERADGSGRRLTGSPGFHRLLADSWVVLTNIEDSTYAEMAGWDLEGGHHVTVYRRRVVGDDSADDDSADDDSADDDSADDDSADDDSADDDSADVDSADVDSADVDSADVDSAAAEDESSAQ
jgi:hypothetical protein